jgi:hypothetical protein
MNAAAVRFAGCYFPSKQADRDQCGPVSVVRDVARTRTGTGAIFKSEYLRARAGLALYGHLRRFPRAAAFLNRSSARQVQSFKPYAHGSRQKSGPYGILPMIVKGGSVISLLLFACSAPLLAQTAALRGIISDESGAVIPSAQVIVTGSGGSRSAASGSDGSYLLTGLQPGEYTVQASTADLVLPQTARISLLSGLNSLNLQLRLAATRQQITVADADQTSVSTDASSNASATTIQGKDLEALADDPEDLQADLQALAGPAAGPNGGAIFVDGFGSGQIPPKESIREIRINQNPFSPEYDRIGMGRIEILTKPGTDKFRGSVAYNYMGDFWNSRNPYSAQNATLQLNEFRTNLSGSLNRHASFTFDLSRESVDNGAIVNAVTLDTQTLKPTPFSAVPTIPQRRIQVTPRVDYQLLSHARRQSHGADGGDGGVRNDGQRDAPSLQPGLQRSDPQPREPCGAGSWIVQWRRHASGARAHAVQLLRTAKLHDHDSRRPHDQVRAAGAPPLHRQHFAAELQRHVHVRRRAGAVARRE